MNIRKTTAAIACSLAVSFAWVSTTQMAFSATSLDAQMTIKDPGYYIVGMQKLAKKGNAQAQYDLAHSYRLGVRLPKNNKKAARYMHRAAKQGYGPAQQYLAHLYYWGIEVAQDRQKAAELYRQAGEHGQDLSPIELVRSKKDAGAGVDVAVAPISTPPKFFRTLTINGPLAAQTSIVRLYEGDLSVLRDGLEAGNHFQLAAEDGAASAQHRLGFMRSYGAGVALNYEQAVHWYTQAAESGSVYA